MNPSRFEELLSWVAPSIIKCSKFRDAVTPSARLCIILQYLVTGDTQATIASRYRVSPPVVSRITEAVAQRYSIKKVFLEISQNSQENICARASFLLKKRLAQVFSFEFCEISKNTFFIEHLRWLLLE